MDTSNKEIEQKWTISNEELDKLQSFLISYKTRTEEHENVFIDNASYDLRKRGEFIRIRLIKNYREAYITIKKIIRNNDTKNESEGQQTHPSLKSGLQISNEYEEKIDYDDALKYIDSPPLLLGSKIKTLEVVLGNDLQNPLIDTSTFHVLGRIYNTREKHSLPDFPYIIETDRTRYDFGKEECGIEIELAQEDLQMVKTYMSNILDKLSITPTTPLTGKFGVLCKHLGI